MGAGFSAAARQLCDLCAARFLLSVTPGAHCDPLLALGLWLLLTTALKPGWGGKDGALAGAVSPEQPLEVAPRHAPSPVSPVDRGWSLRLASHFSILPGTKRVCHLLRSLQTEARCALETLLEVLKLDKVSSDRVAFGERGEHSQRSERKPVGCVVGVMRRYVLANFLSWAADILVGVGLGCLLQISRGHVAVEVSGQMLLQGPPQKALFSSSPLLPLPPPPLSSPPSSSPSLFPPSSLPPPSPSSSPSSQSSSSPSLLWTGDHSHLNR